jgi:hypothetical protein
MLYTVEKVTGKISECSSSIIINFTKNKNCKELGIVCLLNAQKGVFSSAKVLAERDSFIYGLLPKRT